MFITPKKDSGKKLARQRFALGFIVGLVLGSLFWLGFFHLPVA